MISMRISPARGLGTPLSLAIPGEDAPRAGPKGNLSLRWALPAEEVGQGAIPHRSGHQTEVTQGRPSLREQEHAIDEFWDSPVAKPRRFWICLLPNRRHP